jgi:5'/3'-nucleotidase SurE
MSMRVLVTNDDGVEGPGLHALAAALQKAGYDVLVVAPNSDRSGTGAAIGLVHAVPDASSPRSLHRPLQAGVIPAEN